MLERCGSAQEFDELQALIDRSFQRASPHLTSIMSQERRVDARHLATMLPSPAVLNVATVTAAGQPRLSAVDGHFLHGRWYWTTADESPKARHLHARPAISASYTPRDGFGVFCHGQASFLQIGSERDMLVDHFVHTYGQSPEDWGTDIAYVRVDASWLVAFAMTEQEIAQIEAARLRQSAP